MSLPVRGAWIEIIVDGVVVTVPRGRSPCGERGLKLVLRRRSRGDDGVAPRAGSVD